MTHLERNVMPPAPIVAIEQLFDECFVFFKTERLQSLSEFFYGDLGPFFPGRVETREQNEVGFFLRTQHYFDRTVTSYGYIETAQSSGFSFLLALDSGMFTGAGTRLVEGF